MNFNKIKEVILNALLYRSTSIIIQLVMVSFLFGLMANWTVVISCNVVCFIWYVVYHIFVIYMRKRFKEKTKECTRCKRLLPLNSTNFSKHASAPNGLCPHKDRRHKIYFSHAIRGSHGESATYDMSIANCERAKNVSDSIMEWFGNLDMYVPANAERFVGYTYMNKMLTDEQILHVDCQILSECDALIAYDFDTSEGVEVEVKFANDHGIPVFRFKELNLETMNEIGKFIRGLNESKK